MLLDFLFTHTPLLYLTQSLWRDEAYSVLIAEKPLQFFLTKLNFETPFYYILLHFWIKLFGESEIAVRSLSLLGLTLATIIVIYWAEHLFKKHWLSWGLPVFFFFNPMLIYYGFEVRAYGWYICFATLSFYAYSTKKWKIVALANILGFYFHTYAILIPFVQTLHFLWEKIRSRKFHIANTLKEPFSLSLLAQAAVIAPWFYFLIEEIKRNRPTWYFPVDFQLVKSALGNMFIGYEGTPGGLWNLTAFISFVLLVIFFLAQRKDVLKREANYLVMAILIPLILVIGISFFKPLFVIRYLIPVTIAEVILITIAIYQIKNRAVQKIFVTGLFVFVAVISFYLPSNKAKTDIRRTILEANAIRTKNDLLFVNSPLIYFEAVYYTRDRENVYLYNPSQSAFPWYVGETAFSQSQMASELPMFPRRAIIIGEDKSITIAYQTAMPAQTSTKNRRSE